MSSIEEQTTTEHVLLVYTHVTPFTTPQLAYFVISEQTEFSH
jgi:hypothetical protein